METIEIFDRELASYKPKLHDDLGLNPLSSGCLATQVHKEVSSLLIESKRIIIDSSPVSPRDRLHQIEQSIAFNAACSPEVFSSVPGVAYAHTITLCYISVVYLSETLFDAVYRALGAGASGKKCAKYLRSNPIRAFRNALAHGNWQFRGDGSAIEFWARKGSDRTEPMVKWEVSQLDLVFWYSLSRAVGYSAIRGVMDGTDPR